MCLGVPGLVVAIDHDGAVVDADGRRRRANTLLIPDLAVGEWVYVSVGTVIDRVAADEAEAIRVAIDAARQEDPDDRRS